MQKITKNFVKKYFEKATENYCNAIENIGLWESEKYVINKYFDKDKSILDVGCGAGRTTFNLYEMGYKNITGLDLTPDMISAAKTINKEKQTDIEFIVGDATDLEFEDKVFDQALFSFNGLMQIPERKNRIKALKEIKRVLTEDGIFIFTTHDRETNKEYKEFWEKEEKIWKAGKQDKRTYEYGDKILPSNNDDRDLFIHFPNREEIIESLEETGWQLIEDFYRENLFTENKKVKEFSTECRFWVVKN